jgi:hypothetical protein
MNSKMCGAVLKRALLRTARLASQSGVVSRYVFYKG